MTFINMDISQDETIMKDITLDMLMSYMQFEPYIVTKMLEGNNYKNIKETNKCQK